MNSRAAQPKAVPPKLRPAGGSPTTYFTGAFLVMLVLGVSVLVYFFDPSQTPFYPGCTFHKLTGLNCPGCGATRAVYALLHGRWLVALHDNALFLATAAALAGRAAWRAIQRRHHRPLKHFIPTAWLIPWLVVAVIFGVLRNLPPFAFLSP